MSSTKTRIFRRFLRQFLVGWTNLAVRSGVVRRPSPAGGFRSNLSTSQVQLFKEVAGAAKLVGNKEYVTNINGDRSAFGLIVEEIVAEPFVVAVEDDSNLFPSTIQYRAP